MKIRSTASILGACATGLLLSVSLTATPAQAAVGIHVQGKNILEANGNVFVMRGTSHAHTWYSSTTTQALRDIKSLGANTVRIVLSNSNGSGDVSNVISQCKSNRLICVLENHGTTGLGDQGAITLDQAADYWIGLKSVLVGQENYIIINIGNEPIGNNNTARWTGDTQGAIRKLRNNGFEHALMVDAPNWGQDWSGTMKSNAPAVAASDPQGNTIFSIHMYGVYGQGSTVTSYLSAFQSMNLPLVVGEFGNNHADGDVDEDTIMATCQSYGIGYLGWSWSGNSGGVEYLDQVYGFNVNNLSPWGQRLFNGANGIKATSKEATIFSS